MKLVSITVENYKLCKKTTLAIGEEMTAVLGRNGAGKTTLLQALSLLKTAGGDVEFRYGHGDKGLDEKKYDLSTVIAHISSDSGEYEYILDAYFDKDTIASEPRASRSYFRMRDSKKKYHYDDMDYFLFSNQEQYRDIFRQHKADMDQKIYDAMTEVQNFVGQIAYFATTFFLNGHENGTMLEVNGRAGMGGADHRFSRSNKRFLMDLYNLSKENKADFTAYKKVVSRVGSGLTDDIVFEDVSLPSSKVKAYKGGRLSTIEESREMVIPLFSVGENKLYSNQLSEGTFRSLALIFYIMNHKARLLILEEPELSVHLELMSDIVEVMKDVARDKQVVISTHSERIIDMLDYKDIRVIERGSEGVVASSLESRLDSNELGALKSYLMDGGSLGEYLGML